MNIEEFQALKFSLLDQSEDIAKAKRPGYTGANADVLHNFKEAAAQLGVTPLQAWGIYFYKHISAIMSRAKSASIAQAESIAGRYCDAINYLMLGYALVQEEEQGV